MINKSINACALIKKKHSAPGYLWNAAIIKWIIVRIIPYNYKNKVDFYVKYAIINTIINKW
jgi:hypothetical protein